MAQSDRSLLSALTARSDIALAFGVIGIVTVLVIPLPAAILDRKSVV